MVQTETAPPLTGSIADVAARLGLWGRRAPKGLARVEFVSDFSRQDVVSQLRATLPQDKPLHEIELPFQQPALEVVHFLRERLRDLTPGIVSITGFATAFADDCPLADSLHVLNFHRDNLAQFPLCQIWWMPRPFANIFLRSVPDMDSWFMLRLNLKEEIIFFHEDFPRLEESNDDHDSAKRAREVASEYATRLDKAIHNNASSEELIRLARWAVERLRMEGLIEETENLAQALLDKITPFLDKRWLDKDLALLDPQHDWQRFLRLSGPRYSLRFADLARLYELANNYTKAENFHLASINLIEAMFIFNPPFDIEYDGAYQLLALFYINRGRYSDAETLCKKWISGKRARFGNQTDLVGAYYSLFVVYGNQGRYGDAETTYYKIQSLISQSSNKEVHEDYNLFSHKRMAWFYNELGRHFEGEILKQLAIKLEAKL